MAVNGFATAHSIATDQARLTREPTDVALSLQQFNKAFLTLALRSTSGDGAGSPSHVFDVGLPATTLQSLRYLSVDALSRVASCPYSLFELPLSELQLTATPLPSPLPSNDEQRRCAVAALFYAWHIAQTEPARAQLWFCLDAKSALRLRSMSALNVSTWANANSGYLRARFGNQSRYWPAMIRAAETNDREQLRMAQLLGRQLCHS
jgi:hypothetical protein